MHLSLQFEIVIDVISRRTKSYSIFLVAVSLDNIFGCLLRYQKKSEQSTRKRNSLCDGDGDGDGDYDCERQIYVFVCVYALNRWLSPSISNTFVFIFGL